MRTVAENNRARHDYFIEERYEAGLELQGSEVKSLRAGRVNLREGYASFKRGELFLENVHIAPYEQANRFNHDPYRERKLLLHRTELTKLAVKVRDRGYTLVPLRLYFNDRGRAKVEIGLARGKKDYDRRQDIATRDAQREIARAFRDRQRGGE